MSVKAMTWAFAQELTPGHKLVLLALADRANEDGACWPSVPTLASKCSMHERTVQRIIADLCRSRLLAKVEQFLPGTNGRKTNLYQLCLSPDTPTARAGGGISPSPPGGILPLGGGNGDRRVVANHAALNRSDPSEEEPSVEKKDAPGRALVVSWLETFGRFWAAYPRKVGKGAAERAWQRLKPDAALVERILSQVEAAMQTEQWQKDGGALIPYPATWLNQRRWEDEYVPVGRGPARSLVEAAMRRTG